MVDEDDVVDSADEVDEADELIDAVDRRLEFDDSDNDELEELDDDDMMLALENSELELHSEPLAIIRLPGWCWCCCCNNT